MAEKGIVKDSRRPIHVLAVDDSAVVREMMSRVLPDSHGLTVDVAADAAIAVRKIEEHRPDAILLDLELPRIDGITFLKDLVQKDPIPVVICSGVADHGTKLALDALAEGAFDVLAKPKQGLTDFIERAADDFRSVLRAAAGSSSSRQKQIRAAPVRAAPKAPQVDSRRVAGSGRLPGFGIAAVGTSTGGPQALDKVLGDLEPDCPALVVVQHMPPQFTGALARRLDDQCRIRVREASHGDEALPGTALIAPGDRHLMLVRNGPRFSVALADGPCVNGHKPSVDVLFRSVARAAGAGACGAILTGMGSDGAHGLLEMRNSGAFTMGQSEDSSAVYGMPQRAYEIGGVERVVDLAEVAALIGRGRRA